MDGVPSEIVAKNIPPLSPTTNYTHPSTAPIRLTHVCSSWLAFAFDLPDLWSNIHLTDQGKRNTRSFDETRCSWIRKNYGAATGPPYIDFPGTGLSRYQKHVNEILASACASTICSRAPSLRRVILDIPSLFVTLRDKIIQLPWAQLTHLILRCRTPLFYFIVQECTLLERLSIFINNYDHTTVSKKAIKMNNLRDLTFTLLNIEDPPFINNSASLS